MFGISRSKAMPAEPEAPPRETAAPGRRGRLSRTPVLLRVAFAVVLLALVGAGAYAAYMRFLAPQETATPPQTYTVRKGTITSAVSSTGTVATQNTAKLAFPSTGTGSSSAVTEVLVKVGDTVTKGQDLARLESSTLALAVTQAQASLAAAQTKLDTIKAGPVQSDVDSAQVALTTARTNLDTVKAGPTAADLASAEQGVASAWSQVVSTRNSLATLKAGASALDVKKAQLAVSQAQVAYNQAVADRDTVCADTSTTQKANACSQAKLKVTSAYYAISSAQNDLTKLRTPASADQIKAAEASVTAAENGYNAAVAKRNELKGKPTAAEVAAAQAQVAQAENNLKKARSPYTDADLQTAQAAVAQAQAALDTAKASLANATLKAPYDAAVSAVAISVGDAPASPAITLVDLKNLKIDLTVDESDISKVKVGQKVAVTTDSATGRGWQGTVNTVAPTATIQSGVALYTVSVVISDSTGLKPGMTGNASIVTQEQQNALIVPNKAIQTQGRNRVVQVLVNGETQTKVVKVGMSNDTMTEIADGLAEGDQVIVSGSTTTTGATSQNGQQRRDNTFGTGGSMFIQGGPPGGGPGR